MYAFVGELIHGDVAEIIFSRSHPPKCSIQTSPNDNTEARQNPPKLHGEIFYHILDVDPEKAIRKWLKWQIDINSRAIKNAQEKARRALELLDEDN